MSLPGRNRADLLRAMAVLPRDQWEAGALAIGFEPKPPKKRPEQPSISEPPPRAPETSQVSGKTTTEPFRPSDLPEGPFWRIAETHEIKSSELPDAAPQWLKTEPWKSLPDSDVRLSPFMPEPLIPAGRQARFMRMQLAETNAGHGLDLTRLCRMLAERQLPRRLPRQIKPRWPARVQVILDLSPELRPFHQDFWTITRRLREILGHRLVRSVAVGGDPADLRLCLSGLPCMLQLGQGPVVVLSDAGMYAPGSVRYRRWLGFGQRCLRAGVKPLLIAPCPQKLLSAGILSGFRVTLWDRGNPLRIEARAFAECLTEQDTQPKPRNSGVGTARLLAALAGMSRVEPPLLRRLRLALQELGADIGSEYQVWNHQDIGRHELACFPLPDRDAGMWQSFRELPEKLQLHLLEIRGTGNRHQSPLLRMEETLALPDDLSSRQQRDEALRNARLLAASLFQGGDKCIERQLAAYANALGLRRPELLARSEELTVSWALANRARLQAGKLKQFPKGMRLDYLDWFLGSGKTAKSMALCQVGQALGVFDDSVQRPVCCLAKFISPGDYWQIEPTGEKTPLILKLGEMVDIDPKRRHAITIGRHRIALETAMRPSWALGIGQDSMGLFVELPDGGRAYWMPKGNLSVVLSSTSGKEELQFPLPHGFWWHEAEYLPFAEAGRKLFTPDWASASGVDEYGFWASFTVKGVTQVMRWIPPGEFLMGSLKKEEERYKGKEYDETQHGVTLTKGFWLADTACTQALWQAVLGKNLSRFKGDNLPVEHISWNDIVKRFLPALNAALPGLDAGLPTEAQWEYACRAGTQTPFWFGDNITPKQVNYKYPYANGNKGLYRNKTVMVKKLPANGWGLYQMHGNVWEWCADWLGGYPTEEVVDPRGPGMGNERVLRGGCWFLNSRSCRSTNRYGLEPGDSLGDFGFRLASGLPPSGQAGSKGVVWKVLKGKGLRALRGFMAK